jgi:hypothetical protein
VVINGWTVAPEVWIAMWVDWEIAIVVSLSFWFIARQQVIDNP